MRVITYHVHVYMYIIIMCIIIISIGIHGPAGGLVHLCLLKLHFSCKKKLASKS